MPAYVKPREDRGGIYYLHDEPNTPRTLDTKSKRVANGLLRQYEDDKFRLGPAETIGRYYLKWIEKQVPPKVIKSCQRDYRQHFNKYILPALGMQTMGLLRVGGLSTFQAELFSLVSVKSARNIIDGSFRAMWRAARKDELVDHNPFELLEWPVIDSPPPDPYTPEERDTILAYVLKHHPFFYPFVYHQFYTGMRPSETIALRLNTVNLETGLMQIIESRNLNERGNTKTRRSKRRITAPPIVVELWRQLRLPNEPTDAFLFYNQVGKPINANEWAGKFWKRINERAGVRHHKFYSTRHTFITGKVKEGWPLKAIADYCGTSVRMIEENYCERLDLNGPVQGGSTVLLPLSNSDVQVIDRMDKVMVVPTGIEPHLSELDLVKDSVISRLSKYGNSHLVKF
jgi:integrase